ncbi:MAG: heat-inducible transcriptional repressor HrcA [Oscillospiraceae bacterium]
MQTDNRKMKVLATIIETYISTGEPVGSKSVANMLDNEVSSATIRNDMAGLFEMGLLEQPHTSAGRMPSHLGYRMYVDDLMTLHNLSQEDESTLDAMFNVRNPDPDKLLEDAAIALSKLTGCATVSSTITPRSVKVKKVEIISAGMTTVVMILMASNGVIKNKVCRVDFVVTNQILEFFKTFCNSILVGQSIQDISANFLNSVAISLGEYSRVFTPLLENINELCSEIAGGQYYAAGQNNLLAYDELSPMAYELLNLLSNKKDMQSVIDTCPHDTALTIGKENSRMELATASVFITKYNIGDHTTGALGIIGPMRIDYAKIIPYLDYFQAKLSKLLSDVYED